MEREDLLYVIEGTLRLELEGEPPRDLSRGECFVIPAGRRFRGYRWPREGAPCLFLAVTAARRLGQPLRQPTCVEVRDRLDRDHRIHAGGGRERRAVRDDQVRHLPVSPASFTADIAGEPPMRAEPMMWKE